MCMYIIALFIKDFLAGDNVCICIKCCYAVAIAKVNLIFFTFLVGGIFKLSVVFLPYFLLNKSRNFIMILVTLIQVCLFEEGLL